MSSININRRRFMQSTGAASIIAGAALQAPVSGKEKSQGNPENIVKRLYDTLSDSQKKVRTRVGLRGLACWIRPGSERGAGIVPPAAGAERASCKAQAAGTGLVLQG